LEVSDARRLRTLEAENAKLKRLLAETMLDNAALKVSVFPRLPCGLVRGSADLRCCWMARMSAAVLKPRGKVGAGRSVG
jgi:hypothetical protein